MFSKPSEVIGVSLQDLNLCLICLLYRQKRRSTKVETVKALPSTYGTQKCEDVTSGYTRAADDTRKK